MNFQDEEAAMMERDMMDEWENQMTPLATLSDAHSEWHRNSGNPMGTPGCPMDACHPPEPDICDSCEEYDEECICDGAPSEQWEVTTPPEVYWTDEDMDEPPF